MTTSYQAGRAAAERDRITQAARYARKGQPRLPRPLHYIAAALLSLAAWLNGIQICAAITVDGTWEFRLDPHCSWEIRHIPSIADGSWPWPVTTYLTYRHARRAVASGAAATALAWQMTLRRAPINLTETIPQRYRAYDARAGEEPHDS